MSINFDFDLKKTSTFNLSFLLDAGRTQWFANGKEQKSEFLDKEFKEQLPQNTLFNISSLVFNVENHQQEVLGKYNCFYTPTTEAFCIVIEENAKYADFSKEIMMNLMEFSAKLGVQFIYLLIARKNKEYVKFLQGMMTAGFEQEERMKTAKLDGKVFKVWTLALKQSAGIEEIDF